MDQGALIVIGIAAVAIILAAVIYVQRRHTQRLRTKFGTEYDRLVDQEHGKTRRAESILEGRQKRVEKLHIRTLTNEECDRFVSAWRLTQEEFVDNPTAAVTRADILVSEALQARGYPMADFEQRAADISVEHPRLVDHYRAAHEIAERDRLGKATTEELRRAIQHYRSLFEQVLESHVVHPAEVR